jgi:hypothetical protein
MITNRKELSLRFSRRRTAAASQTTEFPWFAGAASKKTGSLYQTWGSAG